MRPRAAHGRPGVRSRSRDLSLFFRVSPRLAAFLRPAAVLAFAPADRTRTQARVTSSTEPPEAGRPLASSFVVEREAKYETLFAVLRVLASFAILVAVVTFLAWAFRPELSRFGDWFVSRFGVTGMVVGSFLADGVHFPLPPQFYLLTGIAGGYTGTVALFAVLLGSELGGFAAFALARLAGKSAVLRKRVEAPRRLLTRLIERQGYLGLATATLLPVSYSLLFLASGVMRLPYKAYAVLAVMRVPRILLSYAVIMLAWHR
jgi:membrane protein YqaA with SNARE-associated domain